VSSAISELAGLGDAQAAELTESGPLSIVVIDPNPNRGQLVVSAVTAPQVRAIELVSSYLPPGNDGSGLVLRGFNVALVALDSDTDTACNTVETIFALGSVVVMVYSEKADSDLLMRVMRTGAREYLRYPLDAADVEAALARAVTYSRTFTEKPVGHGKLFMFVGSKGGAGTTTVALNFAVSLVTETGKKVLLVDLDLPLGDAALDIGIQSQYSTLDALANSGRLDTAFLRMLLTEHSSGVAVLAAPGTHSRVAVPEAAVLKLLAVARHGFDYVVVDAGPASGLMESSFLAIATKVYLVTQVGIPELRNANRLITGGLSECRTKVEIVVNRYSADHMGINDASVEKALTQPPNWRVPNDYAEVRKMQNTTIPLALNDTPIARVIRDMARSAAGLSAAEPERKKKFSLFG